MRLTLRTLLAYLDDILEPGQTKEIGKKIGESKFASTLVNRIRDVMRRRRLTAPAVSGPEAGLDPNSVAEYLDNTLAPESVVDVEKVCLESDVHLAEVAASHQILTLVLGEPVDIPNETRERMYALGPVADESKLNAADESAAKNNNPEKTAAPDKEQNGKSLQVAATRGSGLEHDDQPFSERIPDYLRRRPLWRRALPLTAVIVIAAVWIGSFFIDPADFPSLTGAAPAPPADGEVQIAGHGDAVPPPDLERKDQAKAAGEAQQQQPGADPDAPSVAAAGGRPAAGEDRVGAAPPFDVARLDLDPPPPPDEPEDRADDGSGPPLSDARPPVDAPLPALPLADGDLPPVAGDDAPDGTGVARAPGVDPGLRIDPPGIQPPAAEAADGPHLRYTSREGVVFRYDDYSRDWMALQHPSVIRAGDRVAVPEPFHADLTVVDSSARLTVLGGTSVESLGTTNAAPFGLKITEGRVLLHADSAAAAQDDPDAPIVVGMGADDDLWRVELLTPSTVCGIEIVRKLPTRYEHIPPQPLYTGTLYVQSGTVRFADGEGRVTVVEPGSTASLPPGAAAPIEELPDFARAVAVPSLPNWLDTNAAPPSAAMRRYADLYEKEIDALSPLSMSVPGIVKNRIPKVSEYAAKTLALARSYPALAQVLAQADHEEARHAAGQGLKKWLLAGRENGQRLKAELIQWLTPDQADVFYQLLWGYNEQDARRRVISNQLVGWLSHEHPAVRELAFEHIVRLTNQRYDYRPLAPASQRQPAIRRWLDHVEKRNGLLSEE